jgi:CelD/BcsL family acetyltransferase involved in cellulose biosynthesis
MNSCDHVMVGMADEADLIAWQDFVNTSPNAGYMHHAGWYQILKEAFQVSPRYLVARDRDGAIQGILPTYFSRSRFAGNHLSSLEDGILATGSVAATALLEEASALRDSCRAEYFQLRGGIADATPTAVFPTVRTIVPLYESQEVQWSAIKRQTRGAIRQMEKLPITVECNADLTELDEFYVPYSRRMRDLGTPVFGRSVFRAIRAHLGATRLRLYLMKYQGKPIGGMLCILNGERWTDYLAAVQITQETKYANYLLYWRVIQDAGQNGATQLDLGRSMPGSGVHLFKRKWGGTDTEVPYRFYVAPNAAPRNMGLQRFKEKSRLRQQFWSHLPLPIANRVGPLLRGQLPLI